MHPEPCFCMLQICHKLQKDVIIFRYFVIVACFDVTMFPLSVLVTGTSFMSAK